MLVDPSGGAALTGAVRIVERLGNSTLVYVETAAGELIVEGAGDLSVKSGEAVGLVLTEANAHLFGADGATL